MMPNLLSLELVYRLMGVKVELHPKGDSQRICDPPPPHLAPFEREPGFDRNPLPPPAELAAANSVRSLAPLLLQPQPAKIERALCASRELAVTPHCFTAGFP